MQRSNEIVDRCNGYKILIIGNHDLNKGKVKAMNFDEVHLSYIVDIAPLAFTHYPMDNLPMPWINIHGHIHHLVLGSNQHINVSCEVIDYTPKSLDDIKRMAKTRVISSDG